VVPEPEPEPVHDEEPEPVAEDEVRDIVPDDGAAPAPEPSFDDDIAEHDTIVLGRPGEDGEEADPRARVPAWEDIVFGVRRHR
jgi:hypothetical protein